MNSVVISEKLTGIVSRVTYHNPVNGWSVLRVEPFQQAGQETVTVHQTKVFAGATMEFYGEWRHHAKFGRQFHANKVVEKRPATSASLEKYLGSGLIKGVGPKTAKKIVKHFAQETLSVFEDNIERLVEVPGIAETKLQSIAAAWQEHRSIREVMMFLQTHGISTLFAVRIYKEYGDDAIQKVTENPYCLADDFYGIGFFSADKVALSIGFAQDSQLRIEAAIKHVLAASREEGHCYLTLSQIITGIQALIQLDVEPFIEKLLDKMIEKNALKTRSLQAGCLGYYAKSLYHHETQVANRLNHIRQIPIQQAASHQERINAWIARYCQKQRIQLSEEQAGAVLGVMNHSVAILTGGPGCGKTTTTQVIVRLLEAMQKQVLLMAPTGRAAQRMSEVIQRPASTIHRLLKWKNGSFQVNEDNPLVADFVIIDESSMLDISLAYAIIQAIPDRCQLLLIGDADQLPSVGAGNVLKDLIHSKAIPCFRLHQVFRQAKTSFIIQHAHALNQGQALKIPSPFQNPSLWQPEKGVDCLFIDSDEATQEQLSFIQKVKKIHAVKKFQLESAPPSEQALEQELEEAHYSFRCDEQITSPYEPEFTVPEAFKHVDLEHLKRTLAQSNSELEAFKAVVRKIHPWSSLHYGLTAVEVVVKLYAEWIPKYLGKELEIQILSPMTRGSLGTLNLNKTIQARINPPNATKPQLSLGQKIFRVGDRIIHRRNNYDLNVFNGDIGYIHHIDTENITCQIHFLPDHRSVTYQKEDLMDLDLAYAITIHKSQGSEFGAVIIPVLTQHFKMLYRNLLYTGLTRAKKFATFVGTRRALFMGAKNVDVSERQTALEELLQP